ncbi:MAG: hydrolase 2, exosortase A system-associated [Pseudomonadota bacterium]|nr:hydrolase 2, exosortase A system-associated [Pseudomonadota bacterium]
MTPVASFDPAPGGFRFTLRYLPPDSAEKCGVVILAPPFAEEMNRCRRMTALAARRLAYAGWTVIVRDLLGCGDSSGDFGDASWQAWQEDLRCLVAEVPAGAPLWLWGSRAGALLVPAMLDVRADAHVVFWQPLPAGKTALAQFLRLKTVSASIAGSARVDAGALRAILKQGQPVEIAGYSLSPMVAHGLGAAQLTLPPDFTGRVLWLEVCAGQPASLAPAGEALRADWLARAIRFDARAVVGEQFWQTQETSECPALIDIMLDLMVTS